MSDISSERFVLTSIAQNGNKIFSDVSEIVNSDCFTEDNKYIYKILEFGLSKSEKIDITNFMSIAKDLGYEKILSGKNNTAFVKSLFTTPVIYENTLDYATKLRKISIIEELKSKYMESFSKLERFTGNEDIEEIINEAERPVNEINTSLGISYNKPELLFSDSYDYYKFLEENPVERVGIPTGFNYYDKYILGGGLRKKYVNLIVARPKAGKSGILIQIAKYISTMLNIPVLYLDTEMDRISNLNRIMAAETAIPYSEIESGKFGTSPKKDILYKKINNYREKPLYYQRIAGKQFAEILSIMKRWLNSSVGKTDGVYNDCVVIYDYFKLMDTKDLNNMAEHAAIGYQLSKLCDFMGNNEIACLSAVQANRDGISKESTDVVAGSDRIVQFTSSLCLLRKSTSEEKQENPDYGNRKLIPLDALRFSEGLPSDSWIGFNFDNFNFKELGVFPQ